MTTKIANPIHDVLLVLNAWNVCRAKYWNGVSGTPDLGSDTNFESLRN